MIPLPPQKVLLTASESHKKRPTPVDRLKRNPRSRKAAIDAYCWNCLGGDGSVGVTRMIRECSSPGCALFAFRPYQQKNAEKTPGDSTCKTSVQNDVLSQHG